VVRAGTGADNIKAALILASGSLGATTTVWASSGIGEVSGTGYTNGGVAVTNGTQPTSTSTTAHWTPSSSIVYNTVTLSTLFDAVLLYNTTQGEKAIAVYTFGGQTIQAGTFTLTMPTNDGTTGLLRLA